MKKKIIIFGLLFVIFGSAVVFASSGGWEDDRVIYSYGGDANNVAWTTVYNKVGSQQFTPCVGGKDSEWVCGYPAKQYQKITKRLTIYISHLHSLLTSEGNFIYIR